MESQGNRFHAYTIVIGNQVLNAVGYAMGQKFDGVIGRGGDAPDEATMVFFGDGATSQGDVHEGMVYAAAFDAPVVFYCQNNQWAISEPVEKQTRVPLFHRSRAYGFPGVRVDGNDVLACLAVSRWAMDECRTGNGPVMIEAFTYRMDAHTTSDDPTRYRLADETEHWKLLDPIERVKVYLARNGMADHDFFAGVDDEADELAAGFRATCIAMPKPSTERMFSHVYATPNPQLDRQRAEFMDYLAGFDEDPSPPNRRSRTAEVTEMTAQTVTLGKALNLGLRKAMEVDDKVLILGEDIGKLGGVFRITDGLQKDFGEHRVMDTPLAESGIVGTAVGLAMRGYRPVVEIQFDGFVFPGFDQIISQVAKVAFRTQGAYTMPVVIRIPFGGGIGAVEHHSESPESFFCHIAGLRVVACANPQDGFDMIQQAIACEDPVVFFEPKRRYWEKGTVDPAASASTFSSVVRRTGTDCTVVGYGATMPVTLSAADAAAAEGRSLEVIDLRTLSPLDLDPVLDSVRRTGRCVVVSEAPRESSISSELAARVTEEAFYSLAAPVLRVAGFDTPYPPSKLEEEYLPDLDRVLDAVDRTFA